MVTIGFGGKTKPQVAYATALDVFIIICSVLVFFALAEFALLSFLDVYIRRYKEKEEAKEKQDKVDYIRNMLKSYSLCSNFEYQERLRRRIHSYSHCQIMSRSQESHLNGTRENLLTLEDPNPRKTSYLDSHFDSFLRGSDLYKSTLEYLHFIDSVSRKLFPLTFFLCNVIYWTSYIYVL